VGKFRDIACSIILCLVVPKKSIVAKFYLLALGGPVIMPHRVVVISRTSDRITTDYVLLSCVCLL